MTHLLTKQQCVQLCVLAPHGCAGRFSQIVQARAWVRPAGAGLRTVSCAHPESQPLPCDLHTNHAGVGSGMTQKRSYKVLAS
jgi:hypothetical protein